MTVSSSTRVKTRLKTGFAQNMLCPIHVPSQKNRYPVD